MNEIHARIESGSRLAFSGDNNPAGNVSLTDDTLEASHTDTFSIYTEGCSFHPICG
jgi:hypothetical protein